MSIWKNRKDRRIRRHLRVRKKITGTAERPRLSVHITLNHINVQLIDDVGGRTLAAASTMDGECQTQGAKANVAGATIVGKTVAERAQKAGLTEIVFDRGGYSYHGRVKAIAEAARAAGLKF